MKNYTTIMKDPKHESEALRRERVRWISYKLQFLILISLFLVTYCILQSSRTADDWFLLQKNKLSSAALYAPEQIHLSLGANDTEAYVTWSTKGSTLCDLLYNCPKRTWGQIRVEGKITKQVVVNADEKWRRLTGRKYLSFYNYRAKIYSLEPGVCVYKIECLDEISNNFHRSNEYVYIFKDLSNPQRTVNLAFYGDLGLVNGISIPRLIKDVDDNKYDLIIHNGDFAYDLDTNEGEYGNEFMRKIEPIAARVPYQTSVGNHEHAQNFTFYDMRFTMINSGVSDTGRLNNFYYSFNVGSIHFVAFSTEFYYYISEAGYNPLKYQYEWLIKDLSHASSPAERAKRPWIIVFGHRPMYCSSRDNDDCSKETNILRHGLNGSGDYALEKLFYDFGVDIELYSHEHQYERFLPIYDGEVFNRTEELDSYNEPLAPVHLISGSAGCQERLDPFEGKPKPGSVKRIADYGYTTIQASRCKILIEQISDDDNGSIVDRFHVTKTKQNFPPNSHDIELDCQSDFQLEGCYSKGARDRLCPSDARPQNQFDD